MMFNGNFALVLERPTTMGLLVVAMAYLVLMTLVRRRGTRAPLPQADPQRETP